MALTDERTRTEPPPGTTPEPAAGRRRGGLHLATVLAVLAGVVITAGLTAGSRVNYLSVEHRLTTLQARLTASALAVAPVDVQRRLGRAATLAASGDGTAAFEHAIAHSVGRTGPFASVELVRLAPGPPRLVATLGARPLLDPTSAAALAQDRLALASGNLSLLRVRGPGGTQRFGYAMATRQRAGAYAAYAEQLVPRHVTLRSGSIDADLRFALYFGPDARPAALVATNAARLPLGGTPVSEPVPFGDRVLTLVVTPKTSIAGWLAADLAWIIAAVGLSVTAAAGVAVERLVRRRERADRDALTSRQLYRAERAVAESLQRALLPAALPTLAGLETAARYLPGTRGVEVGGDWYDLVPLAGDRVFFSVGDVVGRGVEAATVMATLRRAMNRLAADGADPAGALARVGRLLDVVSDDRFATILCGCLDLGTGELSLATAGHPPPVLIDGDGCAPVPLPVGPPAGVGATYTAARLVLPPGAVLLAYTDGLVERHDQPVTVGIERLCRAAQPALGLEALLDDVLEALVPAGPPDDIALLALRRT